MHTLLMKMRQTIDRHRLLTPGQHVLMGISGGADSMAMMALLHELSSCYRLRLTAVHLNHGIRGKAADDDVRFVKRVAGSLGIKTVVAKTCVPRLARKHGWSLEMAGRHARYAFFAKVARQLRCDAIATAHTADDQAETILLKFCRGAGTTGLSGIPYRTTINGLAVIRPLRDFSRNDIVRYLSRRRMAWREDATNRDRVFLRNRVRHEVIPFLESNLNPRLREALLRAGEILRAEHEWMNQLAAELALACMIPSPPGRPSTQRHPPVPALAGDRLARHPQAARRRVIRIWLVACGLSTDRLDFDTVERIDRMLCAPRSGGPIPLAGNCQIRKRNRTLFFEPAQEREPACAYFKRLNIPGETLIPEAGLRIVTSFETGWIKPGTRKSKLLPDTAFISRARWNRRAISVRPWRPGDRMCPLGLNGSKKIQDIFTDNKTDKAFRNRMPIFECGGQILWLPGFRIADGWAVESPRAASVRLTAAWIEL